MWELVKLPTQGKHIRQENVESNERITKYKKSDVELTKFVFYLPSAAVLFPVFMIIMLMKATEHGQHFSVGWLAGCLWSKEEGKPTDMRHLVIILLAHNL